MKRVIKGLSTYAANTMLRVIATTIIVFALLMLAFNFAMGLPRVLEHEDISITNGVADLRGYSFDSSPPVYLDGEWQYFPGLYLSAEGYDPALLQNQQSIFVPVSNLLLARGNATYRLYLDTDAITQPLSLFIPNVEGEIRLFWNGEPLSVSPQAQNWINFKMFSNTFDIPKTDPTRSQQELVISTAPQPSNATLFMRSVMLSTSGNLNAYHLLNTTNVLMLFGMLLVILLNGSIFMILRPGHKLITLITLFDTLLIFRVLLGLHGNLAVLPRFLPSSLFNDSALLSLQIMLLMLSGILGVLLAKHLFDPSNKIPRMITTPFTILYAILAVILPFNLQWFYLFGIQLITIAYIPTFAIVILQVVVYLRKKVSFYSLFQVLKTAFIGVVIYFDIQTLTAKSNFLLYSYLYVIFFICHVFVRLYDNNTSYKNVEFLNQNLEKQVDARTQELSHANQVLQEMSVRDALTQAYNRLYFEQTIEHAIEEYDAQAGYLHLCMFDLDHFKQINDQYGHPVGDEQLIALVQTVHRMLPPQDTFARVGGEEFVILFPHSQPSDVLAFVESLRSKLEAEAHRNPQRTTASFGITQYRVGMKQKEFLKEVDRQLYQAKSNGRNCIAFSPEEPA